MRLRLFMALCALALLGTDVAAQGISDLPEVVSLYERGQREMQQGDWLDAARTFEELAGRFPESQNIDLFLFNRAKANYYLGDLDKALAGFAAFVSRYPDSPHRAHASFFLGNTQYKKNNLTRAFENWVNAYAHSGDAQLDDLVMASVRNLIANADVASLGPTDFKELPSERRCTMMEAVAEELVKKQDLHTAQNLLDACGERLDIEGQTRPTSRQIEIALALPFSGQLKQFGDEIYNGAVIAAQLYREQSRNDVKLVPYDTKGDPVIAARIVKELGNSASLAVVGPLTSEAAAVSSAILNCGELPLLAPAATQAGLTRLSNSAFQLSPNMELQAIKMAEYAATTLGADTAVIVTSTSTEHMQMAQAFADRFVELGGILMATQYYRSRDTDFGPILRDLKRMIIGRPGDSTFYINELGDTLDVDEVPVSVDCLFLPGEASQLRLLLPQIRFYNIRGDYLGSDGWADDAVYRLGDDVTRMAVFPSPFLQYGTGEEYTRFVTAYNTRYGDTPARLGALGYDAVRLVTMAIAEGANSREKLVDRLSAVAGFEGAAGPVSFGQEHENIEMPIYRIEAGTPRRIGVSQPGSLLEEQP